VSKNQPNEQGDFLYRLAHPLGEYVIAAGQACQTPLAHVYFDISNHPTRISCISNLKGQSGWLALHLLKILSFEQEDYLIFTGLTDKGKPIDTDTCEKLFQCRAATSPLSQLPKEIQVQIDSHLNNTVETTLAKSTELNNSFFLEECEKLDKWADDLIGTVESQLKSNKDQIRQISRSVRVSNDLAQQHDVHLQIIELENQKKQLRIKLFEIEDEISAKREALIEKLQKRLRQERNIEHLFTIRWSVV
jgi:hypothetical protein